MNQDFKTTTWAGVIGQPLAANRKADGIELTGEFRRLLPRYAGGTYLPEDERGQYRQGDGCYANGRGPFADNNRRTAQYIAYFDPLG